MANGKIRFGKQSGGTLGLVFPDGVGDTEVVLPESGELATTENIHGFKNYIINGGFDVWQRGNSQTSSGYGSDDRWSNNNLGSTKTHSRVDCTDTEKALFNASYFSRTVVNSVSGVGNYATKEHKIEHVTKLAGKTVTLSFWAKADSNKNIAVDFYQYFGAGGNPSSVVVGIGAQKMALTTTWKKFSLVINIPSIIGKTLGTDGVTTSFTSVGFWFDAGSYFNNRTDSLGQQSGTFDIAQVQLEEGSVATPFEQRPYGLELSLCQRYYEVSGLLLTAISGDFPTGYWKVSKRTAPTISLSIDTGSGATVIPNISTDLTIGFYQNIPNSVATYSNVTASAEL